MYTSHSLFFFGGEEAFLETASPGMAWGRPSDVCRHGDGALLQTRWHNLRTPCQLQPVEAGPGVGGAYSDPVAFLVTAVSATRWAPRRTSATPGLGNAPAAQASRARPATDASRASSASPPRAAGVRKPGPFLGYWRAGPGDPRGRRPCGRGVKVRGTQVSERFCRRGVRGQRLAWGPGS